VFINVEGVATHIAVDFETRKADVELCLNDLRIKTLDDAADLNV